jgi:Flp pilus assembly protein TadG
MRAIRTHRDEGAQVVETALALPLLVVIAFGIIQFGVAINRGQGMQAVAREGARIASIEDMQLAYVLTRAEAVTPAGIDLDDLSLAVERVLTYGDASQTTATWTWDPVNDTWSGGSATDIPCHDDLRPDPETPPLATDLVSNKVIVRVQLLNPEDYGVNVPFVGQHDISHPAMAEFECEY